MTTENQKDQAVEFCRLCRELPEVSDARWDDCDDWGSFSIFVWVKTQGDFKRKLVPHRGLMHRIQGIIRKIDAVYEKHDGPRVRYYWVDGLRYPDGYDRDDYRIDVKFRDRTPESETPEPKYACYADMPDEENPFRKQS